ncbi:class I SAM-dependent methyltransferase [Clostridiaceae bacterium M8S5]|nr:class I SAM-dependent methyltransferase [Clostridiaceae bacterium M8S5]
MNREKLIEFIDVQFNYNSRKNLFYNRENKSNIRPTKEFLIGCSELKEEIKVCLDDEYENDKYDALSSYFTKRAIKLFTENNQYLYFQRKSCEDLKRLYSSYIFDIHRLLKTKSITWQKIERLLYRHSNNLCNFLINTNGENVFTSKSNKYIDKIICEEYSSKLQVDILNINTNKILEPVLDIGCGSNFGLVKYLRYKGIESYGIDRNVQNNSFLYKLDWFDFRFRRDYWGTIVSHMAFSNHAYHHIKKKDLHKDKFFVKIKEILYSIKSGGSFIYAPGLPILENSIDKIDGFKVNIHSLGYAMDSRLYCTTITRE